MLSFEAFDNNELDGASLSLSFYLYILNCVHYEWFPEMFEEPLFLFLTQSISFLAAN